MNKPKNITPFMSAKGNYQTFEAFLAENKLAHPKCIPYMGNWVRSFSKFCGHSLKNLTWENQTRFLNSLHESYTDWQIRQAGDTLMIFTGNYLNVIHGIELVARLHREDLESGFGAVQLPGALARKYPSAPKELGWQWLFPSDRISKDPESGFEGRWHVHPETLQRNLRGAVKKSGVYKKVGMHTYAKALVCN